MKRLAAALTFLYPASWRERYGEEFRALLEQCPPRPRMVANTAWGAVGAWLRWPNAAAPSVRLRGALTAVLWGGLVVFAAASGFVKAEIPATHASVRAVGFAMVTAAAAAGMIMAAGAVAPALAVARRAIAERRADVLLLIAAPPLAGLVFLGVAEIAAVTAPGLHLSAAAYHAVFFVICAVFIAAVIVTGWAPGRALRRMNPGARVLRASLPFGVLTVLALAFATALMITYAVMLSRYEPWLAHQPGGPAGLHFAVRSQLIVMSVGMSLGTVLAGLGLARGALGRRHAPA